MSLRVGQATPDLKAPQFNGPRPQAHHFQTLFVDFRLEDGALGTFFACCAIRTPPDLPSGPVAGWLPTLGPARGSVADMFWNGSSRFG